MTTAAEEEIRQLGGEDILEKADLPKLSEAERAILRLMIDNKWHAASEIIKASGQREGLRRMRNLRGKGYEIERRRSPEGRDWDYRLVRIIDPNRQD